MHSEVFSISTRSVSTKDGDALLATSLSDARSKIDATLTFKPGPLTPPGRTPSGAAMGADHATTTSLRRIRYGPSHSRLPSTARVRTMLLSASRALGARANCIDVRS